MFIKAYTSFPVYILFFNNEINTLKPITQFKSQNISSVVVLASSLFCHLPLESGITVAVCVPVPCFALDFCYFCISKQYVFPPFNFLVKCSMLVLLLYSPSILFLWFLHTASCSSNSSSFFWCVTLHCEYMCSIYCSILLLMGRFMCLKIYMSKVFPRMATKNGLSESRSKRMFFLARWCLFSRWL